MEPTADRFVQHAVLLTVTTGLVEAVSLLALGPAFTAMQTGDVLFLAFGAAGEGGLSLVAPGASLAGFAVGTAAGAGLERRLQAHRHRWFRISLCVEALLVCVAAFTVWGLDRSGGMPTARHVTGTAILAVAMGIRGVTAMRVAVPGVPTTLVTRTMTAFIGGSLLHDAALAHGRRVGTRRALAMLAMFAGGLAGALLLRSGRSATVVLLVAAAMIVAIAALHLRLTTREPAG
ncbi:YoaK family protein [Streptomyces sp. NPDC015131]|uniref:YoaK family protein n=1 Tax=Streptomyces sp. NPDC015131 TaxID=3364941 RepID=UPI00370213ED